MSLPVTKKAVRSYDRARLAVSHNLDIQKWDRGELTVLFHLLMLAVFGLPSYAFVVWYKNRELTAEERLITIVGGVILAFVTLGIHLFFIPDLFIEPYPFSLRLIGLRLYGLSLFPLLVFSIWLWNNTLKKLMSKGDIQSTILRQAARQQVRKFSDEERASRLANAGIEPTNETVFLGTVMNHSKAIPEYLGFKYSQGWLGIEKDNLFKHTFVLGATGAGKTVSLSAIIQQVLQNTDLNVYLLDGKGDLRWAQKMATMAHKYRGHQVPIFQMGQRQDGAIYHGFEGDRRTIYNRLSTMLREKKAEGGAEFYEARETAVLQLICGLQYDDIIPEPPRNFREAVRRCSEEWLMETYKGTDEIEEIKGLVKDGTVGTVRSQISNFNRSFGHLIDKSGFSLDDTPIAMFSLQTQSAGKDIKAFVRFFIEDVKDWIGRRKDKDVQGLLIMDEFQTFNPENITDVLSLARDAKLGVILATQDLAKLGDSRLQQTILANCNTYFLMKSNFPEDIASLAGTLQRIEFSYQWSGDEVATDLGSGREQHQFQIDPNDVSKLRPGQVFVINSRYVSKLKMQNVLEGLEINPQAEAPNHKVTTVGGRRITTPQQEQQKPEAENPKRKAKKFDL